MPAETTDTPSRVKSGWPARAEYRFHSWRERRARRRGLLPTIAAFPGYGGADWVRVVGRVLIAPTARSSSTIEESSVRGWRSFASVPIGYAQVTIQIGDATHEVVADRGGVVDTVLPAALSPGWHTFTMSVEDGEAVTARAFIIGDDVTFGVICDVDDTVMVTALPRPFLAAWNSFVVNENARQPVPGMSVLLERLVTSHPGSPVIYLSTGLWNTGHTLARFMQRHLFPLGALLLTDWGPTHDRWFRSGREHKNDNLRRLVEQFPAVEWLLIGDDGQHDEGTYLSFAQEFPDHVAGVAIRQLSPTEAVLAGGRAAQHDQDTPGVPWVSARDGSGLSVALQKVGILPPSV